MPIVVAAGCKVLFPGDSRAAGYPDISYRWQTPLEGMLANAFRSAGKTPPVIVATTAVSGQTSLDLQDGVQAQIIAGAPDVVIILNGVNDIARTSVNYQGGGPGGPPLSSAQTIAAMAATVSAVLAALPQCQIGFLSTPFFGGEKWPDGANAPYDAQLAPLNASIKAGALAAGVDFFDARAACQNWARANNLPRTAQATTGLLSYDGTHQSKKGAMVLSRFVLDSLLLQLG